MSIQIVEIAQPSVIDTVAVAQPSTVAVVEVRQGPAGTGGGGSNSVTSETTSDGTADLLLLNVTTTTAEVTGTLTANHIHGNLAGNVYAHVRAGEALLKGDPVYVSGSHSSGSTLIAIISKADASNAAKMPAVGIMDADLANNATGHMVIVGTITELNTAGYSINAELYVAAGGGMTATPPTARAQPVARVERSNASNGAIIVKVNGLSASDATASTLARRDASGGANFGGTVGMNIADVVDLRFEDFQAAAGATFTYGAGGASAHRLALGSGATGDALFTAPSPAAARTTLELGSTNTPTFGGLDLLTAGTTTLNVYNSLSGANFERLSLSWASNVARVGTEAGGTGTARTLNLQTGGVARLSLPNHAFTNATFVMSSEANNTSYIQFGGGTARITRIGNGGFTITDSAGSGPMLVLSRGLQITGAGFNNITMSGDDAASWFTSRGGTVVTRHNVANSGLSAHTTLRVQGGTSIGRANYNTTPPTDGLIVEGNVGIGTTSPSALLDVNSNTVRVRTARTPASATAAGNAGDICWDADYIYVCTATNTWKRTAISTWP